MSRWASHPASGTKKMVLCSSWGDVDDTTMKGRNTNDEKMVLRNNTGKTALSLSDCFLKTSYKPSKAAEMNAKINHMAAKVQFLHHKIKVHLNIC